MVFTQPMFTFLIVFGIVGGVVSLTTIVSLLIFQNEHEFLVIEKKKTELENLLKEAQLSNLASQIHPHFLFNSLNAITSLIRLNRNVDAEESIFAISSLLRYTIRDSQQLVKLKEEIESAQMYLKIQKLRFGNRLDWNIEYTGKLDNVTIPMLTIQPLVENACKYGIEPKVKGGKINIQIEEVDKVIHIIIQDNGLGMSESTLNEFNQWKENKMESNLLGIGIKNTYQRIKHYYGERGDFSIKSSTEGTICLITLKEDISLENTFS